MDLVAGQSLGRYEITGHLGAGGMGVVYRARDSELGRDVAVKVLNDRAASQPSRIERFSREARAVARLSHPNILDIHDFGTHDGIAYAVTELLQGQTLADRLQKGPIPLSKGLEICGAIAEGLAAAHGEGIIHRDVKPSNIFITDTGQVKVLDFGIARLREQSVEESSPGSESPTESMTGASRIVGTVGYMSPEQIDGNKVDGRSDIFGLGCVMYEVLTGKRAFRGKTSTDIMLAILGKDPESSTSLNPDVPRAVELIVERCLEKQPGERFESARDVAFALQAMSDARGTGTEDRAQEFAILDKRRRRLRQVAVAIATSVAIVASVIGYRSLRAPPPALPAALQIAVIDFTASEGDALSDQLVVTPAELADGLTEFVSTSLRLLERQTHGAMWILPRRHRTPGSPWTLEMVAKLHGVTLGLEGNLHTEGGRLILNLSLRTPGSGSPLRTAVIGDQLDNLVSFQESTLTTVSEMLDVVPDEAILEELGETSTFVVPAFASYLSGIGQLVRSQDRAATQKAHDLLARATELDPTYAPFHESLLRSCALLISQGDETNPTLSCDDHLLNAEKRIDAGVIAAMAAVHRATGDTAEAAKMMEEAVAIRLDDAELQLELGKDKLALNELDDAEGVFHRAIDRRPGFWEGHFYLGYVDYKRGNYEATANAWRSAASAAPGRGKIYSNLGAVFHALDRRDEARGMFERAVELSGESDFATLSNLGTLYFEDARFAEAAEAFEKALAIRDGDYRIWGHLAWSYASSFDTAKATEPFQRAIGLAERALEESPDDPIILADLAGFHSMIGNRDRGLELVDNAVLLEPDDPIVIATIGETLEDLGDRERALLWIGQALNLGVPRTRFENRPSLRDLVADERYQSLIQDQGSLVSPEVS